MKKEIEREEQEETNGTPDSEVPDYKVVAGLKKSGIDEVVGRIMEINADMKELEWELEALKDKGVRILEKAGVKSVLVKGRRVTRKGGTSTNLSRKKLFELGVSAKILEKATTRKPYTTLLIGKVKA